MEITSRVLNGFILWLIFNTLFNESDIVDANGLL